MDERQELEGLKWLATRRGWLVAAYWHGDIQAVVIDLACLLARVEATVAWALEASVARQHLADYWAGECSSWDHAKQAGMYHQAMQVLAALGIVPEDWEDSVEDS